MTIAAPQTLAVAPSYATARTADQSERRNV
jgi:hypothetical protein